MQIKTFDFPELVLPDINDPDYLRKVKTLAETRDGWADYKNACRCYEILADSGDTDALLRMGEIYMLDLGREKDYEKAGECFQKLADLGDAYGYTELGFLESYRNNDEMAVKWFRTGAEHGEEVAQEALGDCYFKGKGIEKNYELALQWYEKAGHYGNEDCRLKAAWIRKWMGLSVTDRENIPFGPEGGIPNMEYWV